MIAASDISGRWAGPALSLLRIVAALLLLLHATSKLFDFPPFGMPVPTGSLLWVAGIIELVGGLLIILGLLARPAAFLISGEMAVAYWMVHATKSTFPSQNGGEVAILLCFVFLLIAAAGPGPWSLESTMRHRRLNPTRDIDEEGVTTLP